ncbi:hypothetical protein EDD18DRAFT_1105229 [Armillaria luteobubalina]|uniref:Uncharacterized protein n=1 Tax=Armillaria luteobubalina TaxID=153913 RepID=A0AA39Q8J6_9AGAR|nr:hypothetical protein EDD18DRAFT_1105229 [Armillaria luteobubalina]
MVLSTTIKLFRAPEAPPPPVAILLAAMDILPSAHMPLLSQQNIEGQPPAFCPKPVQPARLCSPAPLQSSTCLTTLFHLPAFPSIHCHSPTPVTEVTGNGHIQACPPSRAPTPVATGPQCLLSVPPLQLNLLVTSSSPLPMLIEADDVAVADVAEWDNLYIEIPTPCHVLCPIVRQFKCSRPVNSSHTALLKLMTMWTPEVYEDWKHSVTNTVDFMVQPVCYGSQMEQTKAAMRTAALAIKPLDNFGNKWPLDQLFFLICKNLAQRVKPKTTHTAHVQDIPELPQCSRVLQGQSHQA